MIEMRVTGAEELKAKFAQIKADMWKGFGAALLAGAFPVSNAAKEKCRKLTGNCARSIHLGTDDGDITPIQPASDGLSMRQMPVIQGAVDKVGRKLKTTGKAAVLCGTDVVYAPNIEFLIEAFLRPALDENRGEVEADTKRAVKMVLDKASRGLST